MYKDIDDLINPMKQNEQIGIYGTLYKATAEYTFFLSARYTFTKADNMQGPNTSPNTLKRIEFIQRKQAKQNSIN